MYVPPFCITAKKDVYPKDEDEDDDEDEDAAEVSAASLDAEFGSNAGGGAKHGAPGALIDACRKALLSSASVKTSESTYYGSSITAE